MLELLSEYGLFLAKVLTIAVAIAFVIAIASSSSNRARHQNEGRIQVRNLNDRFRDMRDSVREVVYSAEQFKAEQKSSEKEEKQRAKKEKKDLKKQAKNKAKDSATNHSDELVVEPDKKRVFVMDFNGDMQASAVDNLREEISAVLSLATSADEIVVRLESPGGLVHSYGLAASQLSRIKSKDIPLTVCVDKVAASGGYMMACLANNIVAAPFAVMGSIGVVAQIPNFHRVLKKNDIDVEILTAGEYKRTLTMLGENTDKGREKFVEDLEETHTLFKEWVGTHRPQLDIADVATGETWYGSRALDKKLVDQISTSDDYLNDQFDNADLYHVHYEHRRSLQQRIGMAASESLDSVLLRWWQRATSRWFS